MTGENTAPPVKLMFIDDEPSVVDGVRRAMRKVRRHWEVETFTDPERALRRAESSLFDVFVSDYRMPVMNGAQFLAATREAQPEAVRVILSGQLDVPDIVTAINESHIDRLVLKPANMSELAVIIESALDVRRIQIENRRLADRVRQQDAQIERQQAMIDELDALHPGLLSVDRADDGSIVMEDWT